MKRIVLIAVIVAMCVPCTLFAADVIQGKCLNFDSDRKIIQVEEYDTNFGPDAPYGKPTGIITDCDVSTAKIGIKPENGDILRIAFKAEGSVKKALKVMNVSKQDLRKK